MWTEDAVTVAMTHSTSPDEGRPLPRADQDFVTELAVALHKHTIYPGGHPLVDDAVGGVLARLAPILAARKALAIGVAPAQLIVSGIPTEPANAVARELASRLHRRNVGAFRFSEGITREELALMLAAMVHEQAAAAEQAWAHGGVFPLTYDQLHLENDDGTTDGDETGGTLWLNLARSALDHEDREERNVLTDPTLVARAIEARRDDPAYDREIVDYLSEFTRAAREGGGADAVAGQRFVSAMVGSLAPETLRRLLEFQGDERKRREFVLGTAQVVAVETVIELVRAAADLEGQALSPALLRMFGKLAEQAGRGAAGSRAAAQDALRTQVAELLDGWELPEGEIGVQQEYQAALAGLPPAPSAVPSVTPRPRAHPCEPDRVLHLCLEVGAVGPAAHLAAERLVQEGRVPELLRLLDEAGDVQDLSELRRRIVSAGTVRHLLARRPIDFDALRTLADALWEEAAAPMLDTLAGEEDRTVRHRLLEMLVGLGPAVGPQVVERLTTTAEWYVLRNMLLLLGSLPEVPPSFTAAPFYRHEDGRVRFEALKLLIHEPAGRDRAICDALVSPDERTLRIALAAAIERCPAPAVPLLVRKSGDAGLDPSLQLLVARALAQAASPAALDCLVGLSVTRRRWFRRERLAPGSPVLLAALAGLAGRWRRSPRAARVLAWAAASPDPEIRAVVAPAEPGGEAI